MIHAYIALGSNLDDPLQQLRQALQTLAAAPELSLLQVSPCYRNRAIGPGQQPDFLNAVAELRTALPAMSLLRALQAIENQQGRVRSQRWGARTLDLDLLLYGDAVVTEPELTVPHPRMLQRDFVLRPLLDIAPQLVLPDGTRLQTVAGQQDLTALTLVTGDLLP